MARKGQMFVITMVFLVAMIFSVQSLLFGYSEADLTQPTQNTDPYSIVNIRDAFQSALGSSNDCPTARSNAITFRSLLTGSMKSGREITINGDIDCSPTGDWPAPPELTLDVMISSERGETWTNLEMSRSGVPSAPCIECDSCVSCSSAIQSASYGDTVCLIQNISSTGMCVDFNGADGVTFTCQGHSITGSGSGEGIWLKGTGVGGSSFNTLRDCPSISQFGTGITISTDSDSNTITNVTFDHNLWSGILFAKNMDNVISNVMSTNNQKGVSFNENSSFNTVTRSVFAGNTIAGISIEESGGDYPQYNLIYDNMFSNSGTYDNVYVEGTALGLNFFNTSLDCSGGSNIIGGSCIGGNFWTNPSGTGYSDTCADTSPSDGICDSDCDLYLGREYDYLPLT